MENFSATATKLCDLPLWVSAPFQSAYSPGKLNVAYFPGPVTITSNKLSVSLLVGLRNKISGDREVGDLHTA